MAVQDAVWGTGISMLSGYLGTKVMEPVSMKLYQWEPEEVRKQEDKVRPGPPYQVAAKKLVKLLDLNLPDEQVKRLGMAFHYGLGMSWAPVYLLLRRKAGLPPIQAGLLAGTLMSLIVDEGMTPAMGFSAPNRKYPMATHVRGFVAHLAFGLGLAGSTELIYRLLGKRVPQ